MERAHTHWTDKVSQRGLFPLLGFKSQLNSRSIGLSHADRNSEKGLGKRHVDENGINVPGATPQAGSHHNTAGRWRKMRQVVPCDRIKPQYH